MRLVRQVVLAGVAASCAGCTTFWPTLVRPSPKEPLFHSGFPLVGGARTDGAMCSLATVGPEATLLVSPPEKTDAAVSLEEVCGAAAAGAPASASRAGRYGRLVRIETELGTEHGYLFVDGPAENGMLVAFSGLGMPPAGWINQRFAATGAQRGYAVFAPVRDERSKPVYFDPVREARRALEAASRVREACRVGPGLGFVGISMGGLEALLANREARNHHHETRAAVLDPVLDVGFVTENLDSYWHGFGVDSMQSYFQRILSGRYEEWPPPSFHDVMERTRARPGHLTEMSTDQPSAWLCAADRDAFVVFLSDTDPVLGDRQREFGQGCKFPFRSAGAPGHTPLACRLELFEELVQAATAGPPGAGPKVTSSE